MESDIAQLLQQYYDRCQGCGDIFPLMELSLDQETSEFYCTTCEEICEGLMTSPEEAP